MTATITLINVPSGWSDPMSKSPEGWRQEAAECMRREQESWDRSDTDGFLSQWGLQQMASRYRSLANVAESDGEIKMAHLANAQGEVIKGARIVEGKYGPSWFYRDETGRPVWFNESNHRNHEIAAARDLAKGYQVVYLPTRVVMNRSGHFVAASEVDY